MVLLHDEIPIAVMYDDNLRDKDKLIFGEIFTMIHQGKPFIMSNRKLAKRLNCTTRTVSNSVHHLIQTKWIKTRLLKSKYGQTVSREVYGINLLRAMKFSSSTHRNISLGVHEKNFYQIDHTNKSVNRSLNSTYSKKRNYRSMIIKDLQALMVNINSFVADDIDNWLHDYDPKLILKAIHQVGSTSPSPTWVVKDVSTQLHRGCRIHQPRQRNNYGHAPIKEHVPDWAKDGYKPKLHQTSPKLQAKIRKQLSDLGYGKKNKK